MENAKIRKILIWAVILLVIVNITSLASIWYHRFQFRQMKSTEMRDRRQGVDRITRRRGEMKKFSERYKESLGLTAGQSKKVDSIHSQYDNERRQIAKEMGKLRRALGTELMAAEIDQDTLRYFSERQSQLFSRMNGNTIDMNIAIRSVLLPEQVPSYIKQLKKLERRRNSRPSTDGRSRTDN
jgi:hypothetical protein